MKKFFIIAALFAALAFTAKAEPETINDVEEIEFVIDNYYPHLTKYKEAGVLDVVYLNEESLYDGSTEYNIRYKFVNHYCTGEEMDNILKERRPDVYVLNNAGLLKDVCVIKYVDKNTGNIDVKVSYNWNLSQRRQHHRFHRG